MKRLFLFGQAQKGSLGAPHVVTELAQLFETLGHPPSDSRGIHYAVQALLFNRQLIFFRVEEEGYSRNDYQRGVKFLESKGFELQLSAICLPGVGDPQIIESFTPLCLRLKSLLILSESDLFDYLTSK